MQQYEGYMRWARNKKNWVAKKPWRNWFAWYPVKIDHKWHWMKMIQRQSYNVHTIDGDLSWCHDYKLLKPQE